MFRESGRLFGLPSLRDGTYELELDFEGGNPPRRLPLTVGPGEGVKPKEPIEVELR